MGFVLDFHGDDSVLHLLGVRRILEPAATAMAARMMSDDEIESLTALIAVNGDRPGIDDVEGLNALIAADMEFHRRIAVGSGNPVLASLIESLSGPTLRARVWRGLTQENAVDRTVEQHQAIQQALAAREPELARSWATVHIAGVEDWLRRALGADGDVGEAPGRMNPGPR
jgi:DNA-binding FadR family transcriptional regulator